MNQAIKKERIYYYEQHKVVDSMSDDVHQGFSATPKKLSPKYFYDQRGSQLFDEITELPEYYPTRTEISLLKKHAGEFSELLGENSILFELGSGSSLKIRILLEALRPSVYVPMDISKAHLIESSQRLAEDYPWLEVHANRVDYSQDWEVPDFGPGRYNAFFPGSSIGNFDPKDACRLLEQVAKLVGNKGGLLIGVDLKKEKSVLEDAYNDSAGVTAQFNLNLLHHINHQMNSEIDPETFSHKAIYNDRVGRIEMHLVSNKEQSIQIEDQTYRFNKGESIHTESSYKYSVEEFHHLVKQAGFDPVKVWTDEQNLFSIHYLQVNK
ncbi:L-histidine N(alpha)-methyltransferase [Pleionea sediminis]|uniref:L-histidine N(alpha)-methyltransferase n=1 Tax=Pleionea sediminis TaxID=2569479 RepID=UPI001186945D|nr:L-histidine N(alpha)-methyltransferase [Pleionea sediminis]